ncbi:MAG: hypothetical protein EA381_18720 [Planctomycetaceae bacterium]|nr:MAG: hypothetical protein EA381_18720 [Planctomycetaceae bacterium]
MVVCQGNTRIEFERRESLCFAGLVPLPRLRHQRVRSRSTLHCFRVRASSTLRNPLRQVASWTTEIASLIRITGFLDVSQPTAFRVASPDWKNQAGERCSQP